VQPNNQWCSQGQNLKAKAKAWTFKTKTKAKAKILEAKTKAPTLEAKALKIWPLGQGHSSRTTTMSSTLVI
jgi:hypothetical protein